MAVTITGVERLTRSTVRISWSSTESDPIYRVWVDGVLHLVTTAAHIVLDVEDGASPVVDVLDDGDVPDAWPARAVLQWRRVDGAERYRIQRHADGAWSTIRTVLDDGTLYRQFRTGVLADDTTHQFRILAVGENGNLATARTLDILMVRRPDAPDPDWSYDDGARTVTVADT